MSNIINIPSGISVLGNSFDGTVDLSTDVNSDIDFYKTLKNGRWASWTKGASVAFQGLTTIDKGIGYVVKASNNTNIAIPGVPLDINTLNLPLGLTMLAIPFDNFNLSGGVLPRMEVSSMKTLVNGVWKSWIAGSPEFAQGFSTLSNTKGYLVNINKVYSSYLDKNNKTVNTGVQVGKKTLIETPVNKDLISEIDGIGLQYSIVGLDYLGVVSGVLDKKIMYFMIGVDRIKLEFPAEYIGKKITIQRDDVTIQDMGVITEGFVPTDIIDYGLLGEGEIVDYGIINEIQTLTNIDYEVTLVERNDVNDPVTVIDVISEDILDIMYDTISFDQLGIMKIMNIILAGNKTRVSFYPEYEGRPFTVLKNGVKYTGVFQESILEYITLQTA